jgi:hypothetical protein
MNSILKYALVIPLALALSAPAFAQRSAYSTSSSSSGRMAISGALGFFGSNGGVLFNDPNGPTLMALSGLFGLGGDFDYYIRDDISIGGLFRYYSTSDTMGGEYTDTVMTLGGTVRAHIIDTTSWSGNVSTGLGILNPTSKRPSGANSTTTTDPGMNFGFYFGMTILYKLNPDMHLGFENLRAIGLGDKVNGWVLSDYMVKLRFFM